MSVHGREYKTYCDLKLIVRTHFFYNRKGKKNKEGRNLGRINIPNDFKD